MEVLGAQDVPQGSLGQQPGEVGVVVIGFKGDG